MKNVYIRAPSRNSRFIIVKMNSLQLSPYWQCISLIEDLSSECFVSGASVRELAHDCSLIKKIPTIKHLIYILTTFNDRYESKRYKSINNLHISNLIIQHQLNQLICLPHCLLENQNGVNQERSKSICYGYPI